MIYEGASLILQGILTIAQGARTVLKGAGTFFAGILLNAGLFFASHYISFLYTIFWIVFIFRIGAVRVFFRGAVPNQTTTTRAVGTKL